MVVVAPGHDFRFRSLSSSQRTTKPQTTKKDDDQKTTIRSGFEWMLYISWENSTTKLVTGLFVSTR